MTSGEPVGQPAARLLHTLALRRRKTGHAGVVAELLGARLLRRGAGGEVLALRRQLFKAQGNGGSLGSLSPYRFHPWVLLFCYDSAPVGDVLDALEVQARQGGWPEVLVLLAPAEVRNGRRLAQRHNKR